MKDHGGDEGPVKTSTGTVLPVSVCPHHSRAGGGQSAEGRGGIEETRTPVGASARVERVESLGLLYAASKACVVFFSEPPYFDMNHNSH